jgi:hypothetical protein
VARPELAIPTLAEELTDVCVAACFETTSAAACACDAAVADDNSDEGVKAEGKCPAVIDW